MAEIKFGCHCDLEEGQEPDTCVMDYGDDADCVYATQLRKANKDKTSCQYYKAIGAKTEIIAIDKAKYDKIVEALISVLNESAHELTPCTNRIYRIAFNILKDMERLPKEVK